MIPVIPEHYIYALVHPETKEVRYIGSTEKPPEQFKIVNRYKRWPPYLWLRHLSEHGLRVEVHFIDVAPEGTHPLRLQAEWVALLREDGARLFND